MKARAMATMSAWPLATTASASSGPRMRPATVTGTDSASVKRADCSANWTRG